MVGSGRSSAGDVGPMEFLLPRHKTSSGQSFAEIAALNSVHQVSFISSTQQLALPSCSPRQALLPMGLPRTCKLRGMQRHPPDQQENFLGWWVSLAVAKILTLGRIAEKKSADRIKEAAKGHC